MFRCSFAGTSGPKWSLGSLLFLSLLSPVLWAGEGRNALDSFLHGLDTLEARFEQSVLNTENSRGSLSYGVFYLDRPDRFRWDYLEPTPQLVIADGRDVWIVDQELEQISQNLQSMALKGTPAAVLIGERPVENDFNIVELGERSKQQWLELTPKDDDSDIIRILLAFKGDNLQKLELSDQFGNISRFSFSDIKRNPALEDKLFTFEPPPGWDVFDLP